MSTFVTTRPFSLRNNLVNRAVKILKSFARGYSASKYFFFSEDLNLITCELRPVSRIANEFLSSLYSLKKEKKKRNEAHRVYIYYVCV